MTIDGVSITENDRISIISSSFLNERIMYAVRVIGEEIAKEIDKQILNDLLDSCDRRTPLSILMNDIYMKEKERLNGN